MTKKEFAKQMCLFLIAFFFCVSSVWAGETDLRIPDLFAVPILFDFNAKTFLMFGMVVCFLGALFGMYHYWQLKKMPVHKSMKAISDLIYETCRTYLIEQGKFLILLQIIISVFIVTYFGWLRHFEAIKVILILFCSVMGIAGSYGMAWFGMKINALANGRCAFASLQGKPFPVYSIPLRAGVSIGMLLISIELFLMLGIILFVDPDCAGSCFLGFAIGASLGAMVLRIAGGIFTKIADIGADLMKIALKIKEDDARNPGVIADCVGDNAGDSVGPTADGFETYGVTAVALISFILLAVQDVYYQTQLLVWMFSIGLAMIMASGISYLINSFIAKKRYLHAQEMDFEAPLTSLMWINAIVAVSLTYLVSYILLPHLGDGSLWWKLASIISTGIMAGVLIPEGIKKFTSMKSDFVINIYESSKKGGASLNILAGLVAGNYSAYCMGLIIVFLMGIGYFVGTSGFDAIMIAPSVFAFGLVAFGFLGMAPVTIAVDSYGPVSDNAQSIYELSMIESLPDIEKEIKNDYGFTPNFKVAKHFLETNDGAGNTFKATAKPVLIGTAVVGATTMIFSIIMILTNGLSTNMENLTILYPPFLLGFLSGGGMIYWFSGASIHAVTAGSFHAVNYIKDNIKLEDKGRSSNKDSAKVVEICTKFAQKGMVNIFLTVLFTTLSFACLEPYFFIGYLIALAMFGLFQAVFMANAGGAWDNAKKLVEVSKHEEGTELHAATIVGDTIGDPFKDTTSVAINPIIKFSTLFGLLAMEIAISLNSRPLEVTLAAIFFVISLFFVVRSFYEFCILPKVD